VVKIAVPLAVIIFVVGVVFLLRWLKSRSQFKSTRPSERAYLVVESW